MLSCTAEKHETLKDSSSILWPTTSLGANYYKRQKIDQARKHIKGWSDKTILELIDAAGCELHSTIRNP